MHYSCCCCYYIFVVAAAAFTCLCMWERMTELSWKCDRLLSAPGAQIVSMCMMCAHVCVWIAQKSGSHKQNQRQSEQSMLFAHTHTHSHMSRTHSLTHSHQCELTSLDCFWWCARCSLVVWLYSPARNDRNVLKWDNCCFDWLHYYCCCLIFFLFAFLLFAKNHLCLYVDFFVVYIYFFLLLLIIFLSTSILVAYMGCTCVYVDISLSCWHTLTHSFALFDPHRVQALELLLIFNPF